ncbi:IS605 OrfB family transposase [Rhodococcus sp. SMB37]|uniref:hypothetical protein n=1 Tax=Rhodococcus sp. SMB37 TaxID=2512213 RepID=UPI0010498B6C|nr:hypothetical protein [Rhodococcus sp. SMB37]TCN51700.1 IS605 OrfB family transposase [Rhodococcus sp. SMB37]
MECGLPDPRAPNVTTPGHIGAGEPVVGVDVGVGPTPSGSSRHRTDANSTGFRGTEVADRRAGAAAGVAAQGCAAARPVRSVDQDETSAVDAVGRQRRIGRTRVHAAAVRRDVLHKHTTVLAQCHQVIVVETLNASGMRSAGGARKKSLNLAPADAALAQIRRMLGYKTRWDGGPVPGVARPPPFRVETDVEPRRSPRPREW